PHSPLPAAGGGPAPPVRLAPVAPAGQELASALDALARLARTGPEESGPDCSPRPLARRLSPPAGRAPFTASSGPAPRRRGAGHRPSRPGRGAPAAERCGAGTGYGFRAGGPDRNPRPDAAAVTPAVHKATGAPVRTFSARDRENAALFRRPPRRAVRDRAARCGIRF